MMIKVKNWESFQSYRENDPPWIKLYYKLLSSEDWVMINDRDKLTLIVCLLVASRNNGFIPDNPEYIKKVAYLDFTPNLQALISTGFLVREEKKKGRGRGRDRDSSVNKHKKTKTITKSNIYTYRGDDFVTCWDAYSHKKSKGQAEKAWIKLVKADELPDVDVLMAAIKQYRACKRVKDGYIQHFSTWLNAKGWEDEEQQEEQQQHLRALSYDE